MAQPRSGENSDDSLVILIIIAVLIVAALVFCFFKFFWVYATGWRYVRLTELTVIDFITPVFIQKLLGVDFAFGVDFLKTADPRYLSPKIVSKFDNIYARYFVFLPALFIAYRGVTHYIKAGRVAHFFDMETLMVKMSHAFPLNKHFIGKNPELTGIDFYPDDPATYEYSMAMTEKGFAACVPPVGLEKLAIKDKKLNRPIYNEKTGAFDDDLARMAFEIQVGPLYRGYNFLSPDEKKLFDLFRGKVLVKRTTVVPIISNYIWQIYRERKETGVLNGVKKIPKGGLPKPKVKLLENFGSHEALVAELTRRVDENIIKGDYKPRDIEFRQIASDKGMKNILKAVISDGIMAKHAYTYTGLMSILVAAREGSTLPPLQFRWLKAKNRPLWFALNCVGKKVAFTESAGAFAHWLLEVKADIPVPHPEVTEAVEALRIALGLKSRYSLPEDNFESW